MLSHYVQEQGWNLYAAYCDDGVSGTTFAEEYPENVVLDSRQGVAIEYLVGKAG